MEMQIKDFLNKYVKLNDEEFHALLSVVKEKKIKKGDFFQEKGELSTCLAFVIKGVFRIYEVKNGLEKVTRLESEGAMLFDLNSLLNSQVSNENIQALEDSVVLTIEKEDLSNLYKKYHNWDKLGRRYFEHMYMLELNKTRSILWEDASTRYETLRSKGSRIVDRVPQNYIASFLGITPQSLSRLRRQGIKRRF